MWKENRFGWSLRGIIWFAVAIIASCAVIALLSGIRSNGQIVGEIPPRGSADIRGGMKVKITEIKIFPTNDGLVRAT